MLETSRFTSYSACGIPFVVGGLVAGGVEALVARSPDEHRRRGIDVRTHHEATAIDLGAGEVEFLDQHAGTFGRIGYDQLMIATGGAPVRPDLPGIDLPFIHGVQSLDDAQALLALASGGVPAGRHRRRRLHRPGDGRGVRRAGMHGDGRREGRRSRSASSTSTSARGSPRRCARTASTSAASVAVDGFEPGSVLTSDGPIEADLVVLGIGVRGAVGAGRGRRHRAGRGRRRARRRPAGDQRRAACGRQATAPRRPTW